MEANILNGNDIATFNINKIIIIRALDNSISDKITPNKKSIFIYKINPKNNAIKPIIAYTNKNKPFSSYSRC